MRLLAVIFLLGLLLVSSFNPMESALATPTVTLTASFPLPGRGIGIPRPTPGPITSGNQVEFMVQSYQGRNRCLDYNPGVSGSAVFLNDCNRAHPVQVQEINDRHEVLLWAGNLVIGFLYPQLIPTESAPSPTPTVGPVSPTLVGYPLVLQQPINLNNAFSNSQIFALDGDSIILASNRDLVVQVKNARGAIGAPLVVAPRNLADNEFWDFKSTDGVDRDPTSGFIRVHNRDELLQAITKINQMAQNNNGAAWGSVIRIVDLGYPIDLTQNPASIDTQGVYQNLVIPTGVTIRGDRRGTHQGPLLVGRYWPSSSFEQMFLIKGDYVRITGLQIQGPSNCTFQDLPTPDNCRSSNLPDVFGIRMGSADQGDQEPSGTIIDQNDIFDWTAAAVVVYDGQNDFDVCKNVSPNLSLNDRVWIVRNFLHNNEKDNDGYGVGLYNGGTANIRGNTFLMNRHAIAGDGESHEQYAALYNLVLSHSPSYGGKIQQDFDMHGTENGSRYVGGYAGNVVNIVQNTFLGGNRDNFLLRGQPCNTTDLSYPKDTFYANVSMADWPVRIVNYANTSRDWAPISGPAPASAPYVDFLDNKYTSTNPADRLSVGDFNGDGVDDLFLATGAAWYYSPSGKTEWRFLSTKTDTIDRLLFGDFDGDGRTDVVGVDPQGNLSVSWGGISEWEKLNTSITIDNSDPLTNWFSTGDFDGDGRADIFYADGHTWRVSYGGSAPFIEVQTSHFRVGDLRFGDFNKDGTTDVFSVVDNAWKVSYSPKSVHGVFSSWTFLRSKLTDTARNLVVADFNGDGYADVAARPGDCNFCSEISYSGTRDWIVAATPPGLGWVAVGKFANTQADILVWNDNSACYSNSTTNNAICIIPGGTQNIKPYSIQDMR